MAPEQRENNAVWANLGTVRGRTRMSQHAVRYTELSPTRFKNFGRSNRRSCLAQLPRAGHTTMEQTASNQRCPTAKHRFVEGH